MRLPENNFNYLEDLLGNYQPDLVGVGSTSFDFPGALKVFQAVKKFSPKIKTVLGGPHAAICTAKLLGEKDIDFIILGEGERELPILLAALQAKKRVHKIIKADLINDLDSLPFPKWDLLQLDHYRIHGRLTLPLATSRGCPYQCVYCVSWKTQGRLFRFRSPQNVVDEIQQNIEKYGAKKFSFLDDNFTLNKPRAMKICREIIRRKLDISWTCDQGIRADNVDRPLLQAMKDSGCKLIAIGVESASQDVLDQMQKGEKVSQIRQTIIDAKAVGLTVKAFFIVGGPGDDSKKIRKSIKFFKETGVDIPRFGIMTAYPGSALWDWVAKNGHFIGDPYRHILKSPTASLAVQFETKSFPRRDRLAAFELANREAEVWTIRQKLVKKLGLTLGSILLIPFYLGFFRELLKRIYRLRLFSLTD